MRQGIVAAFTEINAKGGVHGRKLQLISRDDGRFDISGTIVTVGTRMIDTPPKVFLTVIQKSGTFKPVDGL